MVRSVVKLYTILNRTRLHKIYTIHTKHSNKLTVPSNKLNH